MTTFCITGVAGYAGGLLAARLAQRPDARVVGVDLAASKNLNGVVFHKCDIRDPRLGDVLREEDVNTLIHLAFYTRPEGDARLAQSINVDGTRNVLNAAGKAGVKRLVMASSAAVYGSHADNPVPLREDDPVRSNHSFYYSWHKAEQERLTEDFHRIHPDVEVVTLRPCALIGPHINNPTGDSLRRKILFFIKGNETPIQLIHEDDAVDAFELAATRGGAGVFNVASEGTLTYPEIARALDKKLLLLPFSILAALATLGKRLGVSPVSARTLRFIRNPIVVDGSKFSRQFGFTPKYDALQALKAFAGPNSEQAQ
ncbi:MAG: SDR family oxidoreductase [Parvularculaceae bacterium]